MEVAGLTTHPVGAAAANSVAHGGADSDQVDAILVFQNDLFTLEKAPIISVLGVPADIVVFFSVLHHCTFLADFQSLVYSDGD